MENGGIPNAPNLNIEPFITLRIYKIQFERWPEMFRTAFGRINYASLVEQEQQLTDDAKQFARGSDNLDEVAKLTFIYSALTFSINVIEYKLGLFARQAARQINDKYLLGGALIVRSMLEHHALACELSKKLHECWEMDEKKAPDRKQVANTLSDMEKRIALVIASGSMYC